MMIVQSKVVLTFSFDELELAASPDSAAAAVAAAAVFASFNCFF